MTTIIIIIITPVSLSIFKNHVHVYGAVIYTQSTFHIYVKVLIIIYMGNERNLFLKNGL